MLKLRLDNLTRHGIDAVRSGNTSAGRGLLEQAVKDEPNNVLAWHWLASIEPDEAERKRYLEHVLEIDPKNTFALRDLAEINAHRGLPVHTPSVTTFGRSAQPSATPQSGDVRAPKSVAPAAAPLPGGSGREAGSRLAAITGPKRPTASAPRAPSLQGAAANGIGAAASPSTTTGVWPSNNPTAVTRGQRPGGPSAVTSGQSSAMPTTPPNGPTNTRGTTPASSEAGVASGAATGAGLGAAGMAHDPLLSADDVMAMVERQRQPRGRGRTPSGPPYVMILVVIMLLSIGLLAGMLARHVVTARTPSQVSNTSSRLGRTVGEPNGTSSQLNRTAVQPNGTSSQLNRASSPVNSGPVPLPDMLAAQPSTRTVHTRSGDFAIPGTAYLMNRPSTTGVDGSVVPISSEPFGSPSSASCTLPPGAAVLLLDSRAAEDGSQAFQVQNRECSGWVAEDLLRTTPLNSGAVDPGTRDIWQPGK